MNLYTDEKNIFGEFGIFGMPFFMFEETGTKPGLEGSGELQVDEVNYLQKGEKILTLLREKKQKDPFVADNVMEMVKGRWELTQNTVAKKVGEALEKEFLSVLEEDSELYESLLNACEVLSSHVLSLVEIRPENREREKSLVSVVCHQREKAVINVRYADEDKVVPVGADFKKGHERGCKLRGDRGCYMYPANFKPLIGELYLKKYVLDKLRSMKEECGGAEEYAKIRVIGKLQARYTSGKRNTDYAYLKEHLSSSACRYGILLFYPESEEAEYGALMLQSYELQSLLAALQDDYHKLKNEAKMEKELSGDYAKSFQTKKNIPQKCVKAMSQSGFNEYFGYVEFDEECDLSLMEELYREYQAFAKELGIPKYPEVSLRFRKLGNHKASGLYYYILKCLCVDVRSPGSMVHEVGHAIDYHLGHISAQYTFQGVYDRYEMLLTKYVDRAKGPQVDILKGKTKYNLQYYLMPTEVFARCFEMYVVRIRGIDNSLCKPEAGFAYPEDEELQAAMKEFFDGILGKDYDGKDAT